MKRFATTILIVHLLRLANCLVFDDHPFNTSIGAKETASLTCILEITGIDTNQYQMKWKNDEAYIATDNDIRDDLDEPRHFIVTINKGNFRIIYTLVFNSVWNTDRGLYQCDVFENNKRVLESDKAFLDVVQIPDDKYPLCSVAKDVYIEGDDVMLYCVSEYTEPPVTLRWTDGATHVVEIIDGQTSRLQKRLIAIPDLNGYKAVCLLTNSQISTLNRSCTTQPLIIYFTPRVTIPQTGLISAKRQAIFICKTTANPAVNSYTWTTLPTLDDTEYNIDNTGQVFMLLNPTIEHDGIMITCAAKNRIGSSSESVKLNIQSDQQNHVTVQHQDENSNNIDNQKNDESLRDGDSSDDEMSSGLSVDVIVIIIVASVVLLVIIVMIPVYYYCLCSRNSSSNQTTTIVHQPEVYFEPQDRMTLPLPRTRDVAVWRRSFAAQAPDDKEVDAMYLEIQSNHYIYAATSRSNTIR